tara:strand:+ start:1503 stop:1970 length:468 start_codon:yes stop_codon:yes gene_type:complete
VADAERGVPQPIRGGRTGRRQRHQLDVPPAALVLELEGISHHERRGPAIGRARRQRAEPLERPPLLPLLELAQPAALHPPLHKQLEDLDEHLLLRPLDALHLRLVPRAEEAIVLAAQLHMQGILQWHPRAALAAAAGSGSRAAPQRCRLLPARSE